MGGITRRLLNTIAVRLDISFFWCNQGVSKSPTVAILRLFSIQDCINFYVPLDVIVSLVLKGQKMVCLESALRADFITNFWPKCLWHFGKKWSKCTFVDFRPIFGVLFDDFSTKKKSSNGNLLRRLQRRNFRIFRLNSFGI